jgi:hypothetical protein
MGFFETNRYKDVPAFFRSDARLKNGARKKSHFLQGD